MTWTRPSEELAERDSLTPPPSTMMELGNFSSERMCSAGRSTRFDCLNPGTLRGSHRSRGWRCQVDPLSPPVGCGEFGGSRAGQSRIAHQHLDPASFSSCATPERPLRTTPSFQAIAVGRSKRGLSASTPTSGPSVRTAWNRPAAWMSAFEGMHPRLRHSPPRLSPFYEEHLLAELSESDGGDVTARSAADHERSGPTSGRAGHRIQRPPEAGGEKTSVTSDPGLVAGADFGLLHRRTHTVLGLGGRRPFDAFRQHTALPKQPREPGHRVSSARPRSRKSGGW